MKKCRVCKKDKPIDKFPIRKATGKPRNECRACCREFQKEYRKENKAEVRLRATMKRYDISEEQFLELDSIENCQICDSDITGYWEKAGRYGVQKLSKSVIDHDHETGEVRGVLCNSCNRALGFLGDSIEGVQKALDYLIKTTKK